MEDKKWSLTIRLGRRELAALAGLAVVAFFPGSLSTEQLTMTTYYPSPYGVYDQMRSQNNTFLAYNTGAVGIGTTSPAANTKLHVAGNGNRTQIDGQLGVGGPFTDVNTTGLSVSGKNIHVQGTNGNWLRVGDDPYGMNGLYSEAGDLSFSAQTGRIKLGGDDSNYLASSCRYVNYAFGNSQPCPNGGVGWTAYNAGMGGNVGMLFSTNQPTHTIDVKTDASGVVRAWNRNLGAWAVNDILSPVPVSGQMLCCKMQQY